MALPFKPGQRADILRSPRAGGTVGPVARATQQVNGSNLSARPASNETLTYYKSRLRWIDDAAVMDTMQAILDAKLPLEFSPAFQ